MANQDKDTGANTPLLKSNKKLVFQEVTGSIWGSFRKNLLKPKYYNPQTFKEFLQLIGVNIEMEFEDSNEMPTTYIHKIRSANDLVLEKEDSLDQQISFLRYQTEELAILKNFKQLIDKKAPLKKFVNLLLGDTKEKELFLKKVLIKEKKDQKGTVKLDPKSKK